MSEKKKPARGGDGRFIKGQSGNPTGRPAMPEEVRDMIKCATPPAVQLLIETMNSENTKPELRVRCAEILIERALGKAVQPMIAEARLSATLDMSEFTLDELRRLAALDESESEDSESGEE